MTVLLINMPFAGLGRPSLGLGLLAAALQREGIPCETAYLNFDFAERIGEEDYRWVSDSFAFVLGGERLFAADYFAGRLPDTARYAEEVLAVADPDWTEVDRMCFERIGEQVTPFLDACAAAFDWGRYEAVGLTASFQQTTASLALARRIKRLRPELPIVFGGAACEGEMGIELIRNCPEIDYVVLGEADRTFPAWWNRRRAGPPASKPQPELEPKPQPELSPFSGAAESAIPEIIGRDSSWVRGGPATGEAIPRGTVEDLDALPIPDFDAYFERLRRSPLQELIEPVLFFETSRGCWWGGKSQCAFCGLNGTTLTYRRKSPTRAVEEIRTLVERYGVRRLCAADNILDPRYFETFLPQLAASGIGVSLAYEMKVNLTKPQVRRLVDAGLAVAQLGIESLATSILGLIGKGATALQNLRTMKWLAESGVEVQWNALYGFPGEDPAEYAEMTEWIPSLVHLAPPLAIGRVRLDRFSPYYRDPASYGMKHVRPHRAFPFVYPLPEDALRRLAYTFEFDYDDARRPEDYAQPWIDAMRQWQAEAGTASLTCHDRPGEVLLIHDTRPCAKAFQHRLVGWERALYRACDEGCSAAWLEAYFTVGEARTTYDGDREGFGERLHATLQRWTDELLMVLVDDCYLSLALQMPDEGE